MGNIKQKQERDSRSGYLMEYNATPLTNQDIHNATVELATGMLQIDRLVEIAYKEASAICQDLLGISAPTVTIDKPLKLAVMGCHRRFLEKHDALDLLIDDDLCGTIRKIKSEEVTM